MALARFSRDQSVGLFDALATKTRSKEIRWSQGADVYYFWTSHGDFGYSIRSRDSDDLHPFEFAVWEPEEDGGMLAQVDSGDLQDQTALDSLAHLYGLAKSSALDASDLFEEVMRSLGKEP